MNPEMEGLDIYFTEARELLEQMETLLVVLGGNPNEERRLDSLHSLFRVVHTLKGSAGMFEVDEVAEFTHTLETTLDQARNGQIELSHDHISHLLHCRDHIATLLKRLENDPSAEMSDLLSEGGDLLNDLVELTASSSDSTSVRQSISDKAEPDQTKAVATSHAIFSVKLQFQPDLFRHGFDPLPFLRYLGDKATLSEFQLHRDTIPKLSELNAESCYLSFAFTASGAIDEESIREAFDFVLDDLKLEILRLDAADAANTAPITEKSPTTATNEGDLSPARTSDGKEHSDDDDEQHAKNGQRKSATAIAKEQLAKRKSRSGGSIRVDAEQLDQLINQVGEMVVVGANLYQLAGRSGNADLEEVSDRMSRLLGEIRDSSLSLRMVPIGDLFSRYNRVVWELARDLEKDIQLIISGEDTQLDRNIIEKISDPLMHLIRNAVDHGIESPAERVRQGKPEQGTIHLEAYHETGDIVIEIRDDGGGLDRRAITHKARERGIAIDSNEENEIFRLIFHPGFSTATNVTSVSGRGVGLDVVRQNIEGLRGKVELHSKLNEGTTFRIRMPLTLANIEGFMVKVGNNPYVIPLDMLTECTEFVREELQVGQQNLLNLRGEILPFVDLHEWFSESEQEATRQNVVVVQHAATRAAFIVDALLGEMQSVIKPLGHLFQEARGVSGFTILGDGKVALILDVPVILDEVRREETRRNRSKQQQVEAGERR